MIKKHNRMKQFTSSLLLIIIAALPLHAIQAVPWAVPVIQPDGSTLMVRIIGDEYYHRYSTTDGYTIAPQADGSFTYVVPSANTMLTVLAHDPDKRPATELQFLHGMPTHVTDPTQLSQARQARRQSDIQSRQQSRFDYTHFRGLVILVNYSDRQFSMPDPAAFFDDMINQPGYTGYESNAPLQQAYSHFTGSVRDYVYDNSNHLFDPQFDVVGPVNLNRSISYANGMSRGPEMMAEAVELADSLIDFSQYDTDRDGRVDMVYFIVPGPGANSGAPSAYLWPHKGNMGYLNVLLDGVQLDDYACSTEMLLIDGQEVYDGIGTICHEFSHVLGLPDLYDRDYTQGGGQSIHPDQWELMSNGSYLNYSRTPAGYSLYDKYSLNFASVQTISQPGDYRLPPLETGHQGILLPSPNQGEFFLIENRQPVKWDAYLPGHGMLVARVDSVDEQAWLSKEINTDPSHNHYQLLRAGNEASITAMSLDSDSYPGSRAVTSLNNFSTPNLLTWDGQYNDWSITDITEQDQQISFSIVAGQAPYTLVEDFEGMATSDDKNLQGVEGAFSRWYFSKSRIEAPADTTQCHGQHALALFKGSAAVTDTIPYAISRVTLIVTNANSTIGTFALEYKPAGNDTWHSATELTQHTSIVNIAKGSYALTYDLLLSTPTQLRLTNTSGSSTRAIYVDDITLYCTQSFVPKLYQIGDVNGDDTVDVSDINVLINIILGKADADSYGGRALVNDDTVVDVADVNAVVNIVLGKNINGQ